MGEFARMDACYDRLPVPGRAFTIRQPLLAKGEEKPSSPFLQSQRQGK
jgi:hypothetical protein